MSRFPLFIHESFFDSFSALSRQMQKKTREFLKKFKENPHGPSFNFEKIQSFKDQSLRTVRVDGKYRAVVQAPTGDAGYHLLWVDNHDEAMDWAKNKIFEWNQKTQAFQLFEEPDVDLSQKGEETFAPGIFSYLSKEDLLAIGTPEKMLQMVMNIPDQQELKSLKDYLPVDVYEYLYYLSEGIPLKEIFEDIEAGKLDEKPTESGNALKHSLIITEDEQIEELLSGNFEKWKVFLHPSQRALSYRDYNGAVKITGGAGTGKTVCALHRAKYLIQKQDIFQKPLLFTTFTKSLTQYIESTIKNLGVVTDNLEIRNIDKLIYELANSPEYKIFNKKVGFFSSEQEDKIWQEVLEKNASKYDVNFISSEYNDVILTQNIKTVEEYLKAPRLGRFYRMGRKDKMAVWDLMEDFKFEKGENYSKLELCVVLASYFNSRKDKPYSHIICDEIQDFSNPELTLLRALVEDKENDLFLVGDPYQNIYSKQPNFSKSGINVKGRRSRKLKINYRTTEEIKLVATKIVSDFTVDDFDGASESLKGYLSLMHGEEPVYKVFNTIEEEEQYIFKQIERLTSKLDVQSFEICVCTRTNAGLDRLKKSLNMAGIKCTDLTDSKKQVQSIKVSTFHDMKGHEFKVVFVKDMSTSTVPYRHSKYNFLEEKEMEAYHNQEKSLYYVVFSRAIQSLFITGIGEKSDWIE
ncbi:AAA family ATPase [Marinilabiliaceae bacterium ANBcel2]|nr:AAA family ATPase [Marinilabiliaceae bacterium ANBcel2]